MKKFRVWSEIDLHAIALNLRKIRRHVGRKVQILVVVKGDAYGHGAVPVARTVLDHGANWVGVGDSSEAIQLREAGILDPILILGALIEEEIGWVVSYGIRPTLHSASHIQTLDDEARRQDTRVRVHLKVDTGMGRLGVSPANAPALARRIADSEFLELEGVSTHFAAARKQSTTRAQLNVFNRVCAEIEADGISIPIRHAANSNALYRMVDAHLNLVRPGGAIYGVDTSGALREGMKLRQALSLRTQVSFLKTVPAGTPIGYNGQFVTARKSRIATIPVGYNDGYSFQLSNKGHVLVRGRRAPIVGTVTMDYTTIDVTRIADIEVGETVTLIGRDKKGRIMIEDIARSIGTVPYDITCSLGKRVRRVYRNGK